MNQNVCIRDESNADITAIAKVTIAAFKSLSISRQNEHFMVEALRAAGDLSLSLVAELDGSVIGHVAFSPLSISDGSQHWYALGPISVLPEAQRQGVGTSLVNTGLSRLKGIGAQGCCLIGHPDYYRKFGFENIPGLVCAGVPQEVFFARSFDGHSPQGEVVFHGAFKASGE